MSFSIRVMRATSVPASFQSWKLGGGDPPRALERSDVAVDQSDAGGVERPCVELFDHDTRQICPPGDLRAKR
jgi:hypothetical protein